MTTLLDEARELGVTAAWVHNKEMDIGVTDARQARIVEDAEQRLDVIADMLGEPAREAFAEGYDATIDFSLNADWRMDASKGKP